MRDNEPPLEIKLFLEMDVRKAESDLETASLNSGGDLGAMAARSDTDFSLTGSEFATHSFVTSAASSIRIPLDPSMYNVNVKRASVQISSRARLNITTSRYGAAINGTLCESMSGQASFPLHRVLGASGTQKEKDSNFCQISSEYVNWGAASAVIATSDSKIVDLDGHSYSIDWIVDESKDFLLNQSQEIVKSIYDTGWKVRDHILYEKKALTKTVMKVPFGLDGCGYDLACRAADRDFGLSAEALEDILKVTIGLETDYDAKRTEQLLRETKSGSVADLLKHVVSIGSALSTAACFLNPYKVDGASGIVPGGVQVFQTESWLAPSPRTPLCADDCDGSAALVCSILRCAKKTSDAYPGKHPFIDAVAKISDHYVFGVSVLGANAGHADSADTTAQEIAGHAVAVWLPKTSVRIALEKGFQIEAPGRRPMDAEEANAMAATAFHALYPHSLVSTFPEGERKHFESFEAMKASPFADPVDGFQPIACEGTTPASASLYTHGTAKQATKAANAAKDKAVLSTISPNIARSIKRLDAGKEGESLFYNAFVELLLPTDTPLFKDQSLRNSDVATAQLLLGPSVFAQRATAGATPKQLATHGFYAMPLWKLGKDDANLMDVAIEEAKSNEQPRRKETMRLSHTQTLQLRDSMRILDDMSDKLAVEGTERCHETQHIFSFAALVGNPMAIKAFSDAALRVPRIFGGVDIKPVQGVAVDADGEEAGVFVAVNLCFAL